MKITIWMVVLSALVTGCVSSQKDKVEIRLEGDPRVGEAVQQVCFTRNLDSWQNVDNDRNALILRMNNRERYKLKLSGGCDPDWAFTTIAIISRPGSGCLSRGDKLKTDRDMYGMACTILGINKWNPDAVTQMDGQAVPE